MKTIIIKRESNKDKTLLKALHFFRNWEVIHSLEEMGKYMKAYEMDDQIIISGNEEKLSAVLKELDEAGFNYEVI